MYYTAKIQQYCKQYDVPASECHNYQPKHSKCLKIQFAPGASPEKVHSDEEMPKLP